MMNLNVSLEKKEKIKNHVSVFSKTLQKSEGWIGEIHEELDWLGADSVYHLLRAVLQTLRDQLSIHEASQFAAQLPLLLKGSFYDCWNPKSELNRSLSKEEFINSIKEKMGNVGEANFDLENGIQVAMRVVMNHVSPGEISDVFGSLKPSLKKFLENSNQNISSN